MNCYDEGEVQHQWNREHFLLCLGASEIEIQRPYGHWGSNFYPGHKHCGRREVGWSGTGMDFFICDIGKIDLFLSSLSFSFWWWMDKRVVIILPTGWDRSIFWVLLAHVSRINGSGTNGCERASWCAARLAGGLNATAKRPVPVKEEGLIRPF